jgi:phytanoyl-CoA hydroxylase
MLSQNQIHHYCSTGWLLVEDMLDPATLAEARRVIDEFVTRSAYVSSHTDVYDLEPGHRPDRLRVRRIKDPHANHPLFREMCRSSKLVGVLRQLLGVSDIRLRGSKINLKEPGYGSPVEWHQDWAYSPLTNDNSLAVGVMLDDCALENGPMMVVPGTHKDQVFDHHHPDGYFCGAMNPDADADFANAVPMIGPAGSMSFHHIRLVHGSAQNTSNRPRRLLLYEMQAADAWPLMGVKDFDAFNDMLICGKPNVTPRLADVPLRMPLPPSPRQGSLYEIQATTKSRYFDVASAE